MPRIGDIKQSRFITKNDVTSPVLVTITGFEEMNVALPGAEQEMRWCISFREIDKPMTLNTTNAALLGSIFELKEDDDLNTTIGAQIVLWHDPNVMFAGKAVGGIRIRAVNPEFAKRHIPPSEPPQVDNSNIDDDIPF